MFNLFQVLCIPFILVSCVYNLLGYTYFKNHTVITTNTYSKGRFSQVAMPMFMALNCSFGVVCSSFEIKTTQLYEKYTITQYGLFT